MAAQEQRRRKRIKASVIERDGTSCCYCGKFLSEEQITMEHIVPDSKRGTYNATNLTVSCAYCNNKRGNNPFFEYCKQFNWPKRKLKKYKELYINNLKIKILNVAKEECLNSQEAVPDELIKQACGLLKVKSVTFEQYQEAFPLEIDFGISCNRKKIKFCFENLIKIIESNTY